MEINNYLRLHLDSALSFSLIEVLMVLTVCVCTHHVEAIAAMGI